MRVVIISIRCERVNITKLIENNELEDYMLVFLRKSYTAFKNITIIQRQFKASVLLVDDPRSLIMPINHNSKLL